MSEKEQEPSNDIEWIGSTTAKARVKALESVKHMIAEELIGLQKSLADTNPKDTEKVITLEVEIEQGLSRQKAVDAALADERKKAAKDEAKARARTVRTTFQMRPDLLERVRNAVFWTPGMTLTQFYSEAVEILLQQMEKERGEEFPQRTSDVKRGRPSL